MTEFPPPDLDWLALRYVMGELSAADIAAWESRLAHDQAAREAVASAVELVQAMAELGSVTVRRDKSIRRIWTRYSGWIASGAVAALVVTIVLGSRWLDNPANHGSGKQAAGADSANELAIVWSQTRQAARSDLDAQDEATEADADDWHPPFESDTHSADRSLPATPSWVTAAMDGLEAESDGHRPDAESNSVREL